MARVDVIIPVYNTQIGYVRQALMSVLAQTFDDWRAVVVNDGSEARYATQLESLLNELNDSRIRYVKSENQGVSAARNLGIASSNSPFIALLDSDDTWYPNKLARQLEVMRSHTDASLVHTCCDRLLGDGMSSLRRIPPKEQGSNDLSQHDACVRMLRGNFVITSTVMFRRSAGESIGLFDGSLRANEDKDLWIRMLLAGQRFSHVPETLSVYRVHATNTSKNAEKFLDGRMKLIRKVDSFLEQGPPWLRAEWPALRQTMVRHAYNEMAETYLESGRFSQALKFAMPWYSGVSVKTARTCAVACLGVMGLRPQTSSRNMNV